MSNVSSNGVTASSCSSFFATFVLSTSKPTSKERFDRRRGANSRLTGIILRVRATDKKSQTDYLYHQSKNWNQKLNTLGLSLLTSWFEVPKHQPHISRISFEPILVPTWPVPHADEILQTPYAREQIIETPSNSKINVEFKSMNFFPVAVLPSINLWM